MLLQIKKDRLHYLPASLYSGTKWLDLACANLTENPATKMTNDSQWPVTSCSFKVRWILFATQGKTNHDIKTEHIFNVLLIVFRCLCGHDSLLLILMSSQPSGLVVAIIAETLKGKIEGLALMATMFTWLLVFSC